LDKYSLTPVQSVAPDNAVYILAILNYFSQFHDSGIVNSIKAMARNKKLFEKTPLSNRVKYATKPPKCHNNADIS